MSHSTSRTAVLLGAGASADAGLPLTAQLAEEIVRSANGQGHRRDWHRHSDWVRALNMVYSAMVGYQGAGGEDPLRAVNIETLISAIRLLRVRQQHEVAPFVSAWNAGLSTIGTGRASSSHGRKISKAIGESFSRGGGFAETDIADAVAAIAREAMQPDLGEAFADAEEFVLSELVRLLGEPTEVAYLHPLIDLARSQPGGVDVVTLNYDLTVELAAASAGVAVSRGVDQWRPGGPLLLKPADDRLNLIKLHGSLDWQLPRKSRSRSISSALAAPLIEVVDHLAERPWIVVGDREKLATDGPTLPLLFAAHQALSRADHLVVVGYSFRDAHVNATVRDWLSYDGTRTMTVLDKHLAPSSVGTDPEDFRTVLLSLYGNSRVDGDIEMPARLVAIEGTAATDLGEAIVVRPQPDPEPYASHEIQHTADGLQSQCD